MVFKNRNEAAELLANRLNYYKNSRDTIVVAVPRGGVPVGAVIADRLNLPLDVVIVKKIGHPINPEFAIGSVSLAGVILNDSAEGVSKQYIQEEIKKLEAQIRQRHEEFRPGKIPLQLENKNVIVTDDGIATGSTIMATINLIRHLGPDKIILAIPVAPPDTLLRLQKICDEIVCLDTPAGFQSVGQFYGYFPQLDDEEVKALLRKNMNRSSAA
jgi:putative phosphoribosyl transferase